MKNKKFVLAATSFVLCTATMFAFAGCGEDKGGETATHEHTYVWSEVKAPNCTEEGEYKGVCATENHTVTNTVPATGHAWGEYKLKEAPTAEKEGSAERACVVCTEKDTAITLPKLSAENYTVETTEATFSKEGKKVYTLKDNPAFSFTETLDVKTPVTVSDMVASAVEYKGTALEGGASVTNLIYGEEELECGVDYVYGSDYVYYDVEGDDGDKSYIIIWKDGNYYCFEDHTYTEEYDEQLINGYAFTLGHTTGFMGETGATVYYGLEGVLSKLYEMAKASVNKAEDWEKSVEKDGITGYAFEFGYLNANNDYCRISTGFQMKEKALHRLIVQSEIYNEAQFTKDADGKVTLLEGGLPYSSDTLMGEQVFTTPTIDLFYIQNIDLSYDYDEIENNGEVVIDPSDYANYRYANIRYNYSPSSGNDSFDKVTYELYDAETGYTEIKSGESVDGKFTMTIQPSYSGSGYLRFTDIAEGKYTIRVRSTYVEKTFTISYAAEAPEKIMVAAYPGTVLTGQATKVSVEVDPNGANPNAYKLSVAEAQKNNVTLTEDDNGYYIFTANAAGEYVITATSTVDSEITGTYTITVEAAPTAEEAAEYFTGKYTGTESNTRAKVSVEFGAENTVTISTSSTTGGGVRPTPGMDDDEDVTTTNKGSVYTYAYNGTTGAFVLTHVSGAVINPSLCFVKQDGEIALQLSYVNMVEGEAYSYSVTLEKEQEHYEDILVKSGKTWEYVGAPANFSFTFTEFMGGYYIEGSMEDNGTFSVSYNDQDDKYILTLNMYNQYGNIGWETSSMELYFKVNADKEITEFYFGEVEITEYKDPTVYLAGSTYTLTTTGGEEVVRFYKDSETGELKGAVEGVDWLYAGGVYLDSEYEGEGTKYNVSIMFWDGETTCLRMGYMIVGEDDSVHVYFTKDLDNYSPAPEDYAEAVKKTGGSQGGEGPAEEKDVYPAGLWLWQTSPETDENEIFTTTHSVVFKASGVMILDGAKQRYNKAIKTETEDGDEVYVITSNYMNEIFSFYYDEDEQIHVFIVTLAEDEDEEDQVVELHKMLVSEAE